MVRSNWAQIGLWVQGVWLFLLLGGVTGGVMWVGTHPRELTYERACIEARGTVNPAAAVSRMRDLMLGGIDVLEGVTDPRASVTAQFALDSLARRLNR